ncbi:MAG: FHA domain-containing protein [Anaerolineales bacterium]
MKRVFPLLALLLALLTLTGTANAQAGARLTLRHLETEAFPIISGYLDARDSVGARIADLQAAELQALEDGAPAPIDQLRAVQPGLRFILAINPAESFAIRDSQANTRFSYVYQAILDWANGLSATSDTSLSLITPEGVQVSDGQAGEWLNALESFQPDFDTLVVSTQTLAQAIEIASQPAALPGMGAAILWITAAPPVDALASLPDWQATLIEQGVPLFIWQVDTPSNFESEGGLSLRSLAEASGGQLLGFSGPETLPAPEDYFAPLRSAYYFQYNSQLRTAGAHEVAVQLLRQDASVTSQALSFELDIQSPNPILVAPPVQIERLPSESDPRQLAPFSQPIEVVVEFPDGFERNLTRTTLFVNGEVSAENTTEPFTHFVWDLSNYDVSQQVFLRVEAQDELGLVGTTLDFPVEISVQTPPNWFQIFLARGAPTLALSVIIIAAGAFFLVMLLSGRLDPGKLGRRRSRRRVQPVAPPADPLHDSPLGLEQNIEPASRSAEVASAAPAAVTPNAPAYLQRLNIQDPSQGAQILPLDHSDLLIGSDPSCTLILKEPSVDAQHARLNRQLQGGYHLADLGSQAGTWVNYAPVSPEGSQLQDGDLVHIGRVAFRFLLNPSFDGSSAADSK